MENPLNLAWKGFFGKKVTPGKLISDYKSKILEADRKIRGMEYDRRKMQTELDGHIQRGANAASKGDTSAQMSAAMKIKLCKAKLGQILNQIMMMQKLQYLHEKAIFALETASTTILGELVQSLKAMSDNPEIAKLLTDATIDLEECKEKVDREFEMAMGDLEMEGNRDFGALDSEMVLLQQLADASKAGDEKKVLELQEQLSGVKKEDLPHEVDLV